MTEKEIQNALYSYCSQKQHEYMIPNFHIYFEADFLSVTKAGFINEYEIKCTRSDFKAEFKNKKAKHNDLKKAFTLKKVDTVDRFGRKIYLYVCNYFFDNDIYNGLNGYWVN